jgi:hypothetical protein
VVGCILAPVCGWSPTLYFAGHGREAATEHGPRRELRFATPREILHPAEAGFRMTSVLEIWLLETGDGLLPIRKHFGSKSGKAGCRFVLAQGLETGRLGHPAFSLAACHRDPSVSSFFGWVLIRGWGAEAEEVPGFAVFLEASAVAFLGALGIEPDVDAVCNFGNGDDVPGIVRNDVGGDEVDFQGRIADMVAKAFAGYGDAVSPAGGGKN